MVRPSALTSYQIRKRPKCWRNLWCAVGLVVLPDRFFLFHVKPSPMNFNAARRTQMRRRLIQQWNMAFLSSCLSLVLALPPLLLSVACFIRRQYAGGLYFLLLLIVILFHARFQGRKLPKPEK